MHALQNYQPIFYMITNQPRTLQSLFTQQLSILRAFQPSPIFRTLVQYRKSLEKLSENYLAINKAITFPQFSLSQITPKMEAIPSLTKATVNGLLRHIEYLERELAKERQKNKALLRILEETKKELKKKYVA